MDDLTPDTLAATLKDLGADQIKELSHSLLYQARERVPKGPQQDQIAGYEHRAFARELTEENPLYALSLAAAIPAYQGYKALRGGSRSSGSMNQVLQGYTGIGEGLLQLLKNAVSK